MYNYRRDKKQYTDYDALTKGLTEIAAEFHNYKNKDIALSYKMGAGLGGGDWNKIETIIKETIGKTMNVIVYKLG